METNLTPNHDLLVYETKADDFADPRTIGEPTTIKALLENTDGWENDNFAESDTGVITCQIYPDNTYYQSKKGKLVGLVAQFNRYQAPATNDYYRIASVRPGESLYDGSPDLVEITLNKIVDSEEAEEES